MRNTSHEANSHYPMRNGVSKASFQFTDVISIQLVGEFDSFWDFQGKIGIEITIHDSIKVGKI